MKLTVKDIKGNSAGEMEVAFALIENAKGSQAVHDTVVAFQASQRMGTACAKTVGEVNGTNKKPWRQKGTGRARAGSFRSPLWPGGGVVFGPRPRDFGKKVSKATKTLSLRKALSARLVAGDVVLVDDVKLASGKTKEFVGILQALDVAGATTLVVHSGADKNLVLASRNVPCVELVSGESLNSYQILRYDKLVFTRPAFEQVSSRLK